MHVSKTILAALIVTAASLPMAATAQAVPGPHPDYVGALNSLRAARHYLADNWAWTPVKRDDDEAVRTIDRAIDDIRLAVHDDHMGKQGEIPTDTSLKPHDRFRKADELLFNAHKCLARPEVPGQATNLRDRTLADVDHAHDIVVRAESTAHWE